MPSPSRTPGSGPAALLRAIPELRPRVTFSFFLTFRGAEGRDNTDCFWAQNLTEFTCRGCPSAARVCFPPPCPIFAPSPNFGTNKRTRSGPKCNARLHGRECGFHPSASRIVVLRQRMEPIPPAQIGEVTRSHPTAVWEAHSLTLPSRFRERDTKPRCNGRRCAQPEIFLAK